MGPGLDSGDNGDDGAMRPNGLVSFIVFVGVMLGQGVEEVGVPRL